MTNTQTISERGDVVAVILIIIVVAIIGALGFIAYQNFTPKSEPVAQVTPERQEKVLSLDKWGLEIPLGTSSVPYEVFVGGSNPDGTDVIDYGITFSGYTSIEGCEPKGQSGPAPLGHIGIVDKEESAVRGITRDGTVTINGVEYEWKPGFDNETCAKNAKDQQTILNAANEIRQLFKGLRKI